MAAADERIPPGEQKFLLRFLKMIGHIDHKASTIHNFTARAEPRREFDDIEHGIGGTRSITL